jgi:hypothetical protein
MAISTLNPEEREQITSTLADWGVERWLSDVLLADATFGPGAIGWPDNNRGVAAGLGILIDPGRDPQIAAVFHRRRKIHDDRKFVASYQTTPTSAWAILSPEGPEALIGIQAAITKPRHIQRTFLLLGSRNLPLLEPLTKTGSTIWLVPKHIGVREWAREGTGTAYDIWKHSLPLGYITTPMASIQLALHHLHQPARP